MLGQTCGLMCEISCSRRIWKLQGALGKLTLVKDKASDGVAAVRKKLGRNKDIQCRVHLKVRDGCSLLHTPSLPATQRTKSCRTNFCFSAQRKLQIEQSRACTIWHMLSEPII